MMAACVEEAEQSYGQINPAYESSRPDSLYSSSVNGGGNMAGHIVQQQHPQNQQQHRPSLALTSYSNFHGQRKGGGGGGGDHLPGMNTSLTFLTLKFVLY